MKTKVLAVAASSAIVALMSVGCHRQQQPPKDVPVTAGQEISFEDEIEAVGDAVVPDTIHASLYHYEKARLESTTVARYFGSDSTEIYLSVLAAVPDEFPALNSYVGEKITTLYDYVTDATMDYGGASSTEQLTELIDSLGRRWEGDIVPLYEGAIVPAFNLQVNLQPAWANEQVVTYAVFDAYYTGGPHGISDYYLETVDPATGHAYDVEELIRPDKMSELRQSLVTTMAQDKGQSVEAFLAGVNDFLTPDQPITIDNFPIYHIALTGQGLVVVYPSYSIAPYSDGQPAYLIPSEDFVAI